MLVLAGDVRVFCLDLSIVFEPLFDFLGIL